MITAPLLALFPLWLQKDTNLHRYNSVTGNVGPGSLTEHQGLHENNHIIYTNKCYTGYELDRECLEIGKHWTGTMIPKGEKPLDEVRKIDEEP